MKWFWRAAVVAVLLAPGSAFALCNQPGAGNSQYYDGNGESCVAVTGLAGGSTVTPTSKSGTITLGGTSQTLMAANATRTGCSVQPQSGDVWINTTGSAAAAIQPSFYLPAPGVFTCPSGFRGAITIFGATTGTTFAAEEDTVP